MMRPSASTRMRVHSAMTNSMLCSMTTKVEPCSALIAFSRSRRLASMVRLTPPAGSSSSTRRGPGHERHRDVEQLLLAVARARPPARRRDGRAGRSRSCGRPRRRARHRAGRTGATASCPCAPGPARIRFSRTVSCGKTCSSWKVRLTPSRLRSQGRMPVTARPSRRTSPALGCSWPRMQLNRVDLPLPFGPMMPRISPSWTSKDTPSTATNAAEALLQVAHLEDGAHRAISRAAARCGPRRRVTGGDRRGRAGRTGRTPSAPSPAPRSRSGSSPARSAAIRAAARRRSAPRNGPKK